MSATTPPVCHKAPIPTIGGSFRRVAKCIFIMFWGRFPLPVPCCPDDVTISLVSTETLEVMWSPVKGAELYETTAEQTNNVIHCNDTAPVCALSDLTCNAAYSVTVTPCSDLRGCNRTCTSRTHETGNDMANYQQQRKRAVKNPNPSGLLQLRVLQRSWTWRKPTAPHTESFLLLPTRPTRITPSLPSDTTTNTLARQQTIPVSSHSCHVVQPTMSQQSPPQRWGEVYQDSVKHWKQVWKIYRENVI